MPRQRRRQSGIALLAAMALVGLVGLLVIGALASSTLAQRGASASESEALLATAADFAASAPLADPEQYGLADLPLGRPRTFSAAIPGASAPSAEVTVTRLRNGVVWLVGAAWSHGRDSAERRISIVARFPVAGPVPVAAVVSRGSVNIGRNVALSLDASPEADCADPPVADILIAPGATTTGADSLRVAQMAVAADSAAYHLTVSQVGALDSSLNVQHVRGDTTIAAGSFAGVMLVDGALTITGPFSATGLVIARGRIDARAGGLTVVGGLMSFANPGAGLNAIDLASASVRYSPCAVARAFRAAKPPHPARQRSWAELF